MRESFAIGRNKLYGFDFDNNEGAAWAQDDGGAAFGDGAAVEEVIEEAAKEAEGAKGKGLGEEGVEMSAKEAFFEFSQGPRVRPPQMMPPRPPQVHPPRPPQQPIPPIPPRQPIPPRPPGPGHNFNPDSGSAPRFAPPAFIPQRAPALRAIDAGAITRCLYSNTYVWLNNRQEFWFFPTFIGRKSIAGYRWMHRNWVFVGFSLNMIDSFFCGGR
ncbi:MAG: hypothetical protein LBE55_06915 [Clostridiales bacterium]|jgi:hypothetical protein|nr:hypothetical protein [Clostridiales bacterium]